MQKATVSFFSTSMAQTSNSCVILPCHIFPKRTLILKFQYQMAEQYKCIYISLFSKLLMGFTFNGTNTLCSEGRQRWLCTSSKILSERFVAKNRDRDYAKISWKNLICTCLSLRSHMSNQVKSACLKKKRIDRETWPCCRINIFKSKKKNERCFIDLICLLYWDVSF